MSKTKSSEKSHYEILFIVPNKFTLEEASKIDLKVKKIIVDNDGEVTYAEEWGKKKLAYPIKRFNHGYYFLCEFDLWGKDLLEIDHLLRMSSEVLRHQIVKKEKRTKEEIEKDIKKSDELAKKESTEETPVKAEKVEKKLMGDVKKEEKVEKKKADLKDLDKKLDDILSADDLL